MCGIVGLFAKSSEIEERLGAHLAAMLVQMSSRGPDSAGVAVYRDPAPGGASKLTLYSPEPREVWVEVRDALRDAFGACEEPSVRASHAVLRRRRRRGRRRVVGAGEPPRPAGDERRPGDRDLQGDRPARGVRQRVRARGHPRNARARPHAHGDGEQSDDGGIASVLDGSRPLPRPQRLALEPQPAPREPQARGHRVPDRERHRGCRRLSRLAAARGRLAGAGARGLPRTTSTASTRSRSGRRTGSRCFATRSRASRRFSPRPTTGLRCRPSGGRSRCFPAPRRRRRGSRSPASCTRGRRRWSDGGRRA